MKTLIVIGVLLFLSSLGYYTLVQPELATSLALEQFKNPSIAVDSVSRWHMFDYLWLGYIFLVIGYLARKVYDEIK